MCHFLKNVWALTRPYWCSRDKWRAFALLVGMLIVGVLLVRVQVLTNDLTRHFYDALQNYQPHVAIHLALRYLVLVGLFALLAAGSAYLGGTLLNRWRRWLTVYYLDRWFDKKAFYRLSLCHKAVDNPDQRISDDIEQFTSITLGLFNGFYTKLIQLITFVVVLWQLSGVFRFNLGHWHIALSGYLFWCALVYAVVSTTITFFIGRTLSRLNYQQQHFNADFRFGLMRVRENAEAIAVLAGERAEKSRLTATYQPIFSNYARLILVDCRLTFFTKAVSLLSMMIGLLCALPKFMTEKMSVGDLMQISSAFAYVVDGLCFFMEAYTTIANWRAVTERLSEFSVTMQDSDASVNALQQRGERLVLQGVRLQTPEGRVLLQDFSCVVDAGERVLIMGAFGSGKSTLLRSIAGVWPYVTGRIDRPQGRSLFLSQKPYWPITTLHAALCFPSTHFSAAEIHAVLTALDLTRYIPLLDHQDHWMQVLSLGEQQALGFARAVLARPQWLFLDEASSALDENSETQLYRQLFALLPRTTVVSVGHRSSLIELHQRVIKL